MLMFNLTDFSLSYVDTTVSLWFYFKDEAINFNADFTNTGDFKSFVCKVKLFGNTIAQPCPNADSGVPENASIVVPLKYLSYFSRYSTWH